MASAKWHMPLDPDCPEVKDFWDALADDPSPLTRYHSDEIVEDFERRHRMKCKRCQEYGAANVEVVT